MEKLTFKQYLDSKERLREAIEHTPVQLIEYQVKRHCKLTVGEDKASRDHVSLNPKQKVIVEWRYNNPDETPEPLSVRFENVRNILESDEYSVMWNGDRLQKWLSKNTFEINKVV